MVLALPRPPTTVLHDNNNNWICTRNVLGFALGNVHFDAVLYNWHLFDKERKNTFENIICEIGSTVNNNGIVCWRTDKRTDKKAHVREKKC